MIGKIPFVILALTLAMPSSADVGPKPSMVFTFTLPDQIEIKSGMLYNCEDRGCTHPTPLRPLGPQRISCAATWCTAIAYGFGHYFQLELTLTDGQIVKSSPTKVAGFESRFSGVIKGKDLILTPKP